MKCQTEFLGKKKSGQKEEEEWNSLILDTQKQPKMLWGQQEQNGRSHGVA